MADHGLGHEIEVGAGGRTPRFDTDGVGQRLDFSATVGSNLRKLRGRSGLSLEKLASLSGVSRGMIGRIEMGRSAPTIGLLSRLADALDVQLISLIAEKPAATPSVLRHGRSTRIETSGGKFVTRPLSRPRHDGTAFFEVSIARGHFEEGERHGDGVRAHVVVASGIVVITVAGEQPTTLAARDAIEFPADAVHGYHNVGDQEAILYVTLSPDTSRA
jgi:transcriptional regulator with XRE-family HTH domain